MNSADATRTLMLRVGDAFAADIGPQIGFGGASGGATTPYTYATIAGRKEGASTYLGYLQFSVAGFTNGVISERMRITSAGNVGIGTATPLRELHVASVPLGGGVAITGGAPGLVISNADTEPNSNPMAVLLALATAAGHYALPNPGDSMLCTQGASRGDLYITASYQGGGALRSLLLQPTGGNVGIGTTAPRSALSIITATPSTPATATQLTIGEATNATGYQLSLGYYYDSANSCYKGAIQSEQAGTAWSLLLNAAGGAVGIHQSNPICVLDIVAAGPPAPSGNSSSGILISAGYGGQSLNIGIAAYGWLQAAYSNNAGTPIPLVLQPVAGSVGIGASKTAPAYTLDVGGDVNCTGAFRVNGTPISTGGIAGITCFVNGGSMGVATSLGMNGGGGGAVVGGNLSAGLANYTISFTSDARLKRNVTTLDGGLSIIERLRPIRAEWNGMCGKKLGEPIVSVIAQELQQVIPDAVYPFPARMRPGDAADTELLGVEQMAIIAHLYPRRAAIGAAVEVS